MQRFCRIFLCAVLALAVQGGNARASGTDATPTDPVIHLTKEQATDFRASLDALASQGHIAIVAEGVPLKATLTGKDAPSVPEGTPLTTAVTRVATAYDYDAERDGPVFLLKKRYTDPHDLPGVTLEECQLSLADVAQILDAFSPHYPYSIRRDIIEDIALGFVNTLSPTQEQAMQNKALYCRDLTPEQQSLIRNAFLYMFVQMPLIQVQPILGTIQQAPHASLTLEQQNRPGLFLSMSGSDGGTSSLTLSQNTLIVAGPNVPPPAKGPVPGKSADTLGQTVAKLTVYGQPVGIDAALAEKPVMVAGIDAAPPMKVLQALASVYGLDTAATAKGGKKLTRRLVSIPSDLRDMPGALWAAMPEPFSRAAHAGETIPIALPVNAGETEDHRWQRDQENTQRRWQNQQRPDDLRAETVRQLLDRLRPRFKAASSLTVASLSPADRDRLGVALMGIALATLSTHFSAQYSSPVTACLSHFGDIVVSGKPTPDPRTPERMTHSLHLSETNPATGVTVSLGGIGFD